MVVKKQLQFVSILLLIVTILSLLPISTYAATGGALYKGKYNYRDPKLDNEANQDLSEEQLEENRQKVFEIMLKEGATAEAAAGMLGNIRCESDADPTILEMGYGLKVWSDLVRHWDSGRDNGFGIFQFTHIAAIEPVFDAAYELKVSCLTMDAQITGILRKIKPDDHYAILWENKNNLDTEKYITACTVCLQANYGRGTQYLRLENTVGRSVINKVIETGDLSQLKGMVNTGENSDFNGAIAIRVAKALEAYEKYKNIKPGSSSSENKSGNGSSSIKEEWEVLGFKNPMEDTAVALSLANRDMMSLNDSVKIVRIKDNMTLARSVDVWQVARICLIFVGMLMISYAILLSLATMADRVKLIASFGFVDVVSLGAMHYVGPDRQTLDVAPNRRFKSTQGMVLVILSYFIFGLLLISGAVLPKVMNVVYSIMQFITSGGA